MPKKRDEKINLPAPEEVQKGFIPVRLKPTARYGRVVIGDVVVERTGVALLTPAQFEEYAEEYDLEVVDPEK